MSAKESERAAPEPKRVAPEPKRAAPEPKRAAPEPKRAAPEPKRAAKRATPPGAYLEFAGRSRHFDELLGVELAPGGNLAICDVPLGPTRSLLVLAERHAGGGPGFHVDWVFGNTEEGGQRYAFTSDGEYAYFQDRRDLQIVDLLSCTPGRPADTFRIGRVRLCYATERVAQIDSTGKLRTTEDGGRRTSHYPISYDW